MLSSRELPVLVRTKIMEYAEEKAAGILRWDAEAAPRVHRRAAYGGYRSRLRNVVKGG